MKNIWIVMKKELLRVFKDRSMVLGLILPGLFIFVIYSFIGTYIQDTAANSQNTTYNVVAVNLPQSIEQIFELEELDFDVELEKLTANSEAAVNAIVNQREEQIKDGTIDIILIFEIDFVAKAELGDEPSLQIFYNPFGETSPYAYAKVSAAMDAFKTAVIGSTIFAEELNTIFDDKSVLANTFSMLMPMLIISFLFSGCMSVATDSIAGEKERGTIATILVTPLKRSELAFGKVFSLSIIASVSVLSSFLGLVLSMPKMMGVDSIAELYGFMEFSMLFLVLLSTILLIIGGMAVLSSFAKSIREASMYILPFMMVSTLVGLLTFASNGAVGEFYFYLIPIYNSVQAMVSILTFDVNVANLLITFASNLVYAVLCVFGLTKLFNSEKVMFKR